VVGGGDRNSAVGDTAVVAGGEENKASGFWSVIAGGRYNKAEGEASSLCGGDSNNASGKVSFVGGGSINTASGWWSTIPGGYWNEATGDNSFAAGYRAKSKGNGSFVWGDSNDKDIIAWGSNEFVARATGGFWLITAIDANGNPTEGMQLPAGSSTWAPIGTHKTNQESVSSNVVEELRKENADLKQQVESLETRLAGLEKLILAGSQP